MFIDFIFSFDLGNGITLGYAALGLLLIATIFTGLALLIFIEKQIKSQKHKKNRKCGFFIRTFPAPDYISISKYV